MDGFMSLSGLRPWPEERLAEFGRRQYYGVEAGTHDAQGRIDRCAHVTAVLMMLMPKERAPAVLGNTASVRSSCVSLQAVTHFVQVPLQGFLSTA